MILLRRMFRFRLRIRLRLHRLPKMPSLGARLVSADRIDATPLPIMPLLAAPIDPKDSVPVPVEARAVTPKRRTRRGLPPALLLAVTPVRRLLSSREFWLVAIAVLWAVAAIAIQ